MEGKFERMSILNCYAHNLNTASFDEYYWNLGADVFACFVVNLVVFVGKYYYEVVIVDDLLAHIGWTTLDFIPETQEGEVEEIGVMVVSSRCSFEGNRKHEELLCIQWEERTRLLQQALDLLWKELEGRRRDWVRNRL